MVLLDFYPEGFVFSPSGFYPEGEGFLNKKHKVFFMFYILFRKEYSLILVAHFLECRWKHQTLACNISMGDAFAVVSLQYGSFFVHF